MKKDYVGQWFEIYRRNTEGADILYKVEANGKSELINFAHEKVDGAGGLFKLAEQFNWKIKNLATPTPPRAISRFKFFINCLMFLHWTKPRKKNIWPFEFKKSNTVEGIYESCTFNAEETQKLKDKANVLGISLNTLLFFSLNKSLEKQFNWTSGKRSWWVPVNMRNDLGIDINDSKFSGNYVSNFMIDLSPSMSSLQYQQAITHSLKQQKHLATWWWQHLGKYVPESVVEFLALSNLKNNHCVGAFSNLGEWSCDQSDANVSFFVPTLLSHPIGASALIWNKKLNIGIRIYPTFKLNPDELNSVLQKWTQQLVL
ncbi:MAG: hypothetical protein ABL930_08910 [Pseudobdellovibrio sp.]